MIQPTPLSPTSEDASPDTFRITQKLEQRGRVSAAHSGRHHHLSDVQHRRSQGQRQENRPAAVASFSVEVAGARHTRRRRTPGRATAASHRSLPSCPVSPTASGSQTGTEETAAGPSPSPRARTARDGLARAEHHTAYMQQKRLSRYALCGLWPVAVLDSHIGVSPDVWNYSILGQKKYPTMNCLVTTSRDFQYTKNIGQATRTTLSAYFFINLIFAVVPYAPTKNPGR